MGAAITQTEQRVLVRDHLAADVEVELGVVVDRAEQEVLALVLQDHVVGHLLRRALLPRGVVGDR